MVSNIYCVVFLFCLSSSCVPYVAGFSGLSISDYSSVFSNGYLNYTTPSFTPSNSSYTIFYMNIIITDEDGMTVT